MRVFEKDGTTICRMTEGFEFFTQWAKESEKDEDKRTFLAWQVNGCNYGYMYTYKHTHTQTWDLMRIMWYGLVNDFTTSNPGYYINPRRVNGSATETIFGQLKQTTSSNLTAANYETAKATLLTKQQSSSKDGEQYRSAKLYLRQSNLSKETNYIQ